jgi:hypothetical protein
VGAQNDTINRVNEEGLKYGFWQIQFDEGALYSEGRFEIVTIELSDEDRFFYNIPADYDTVVMRSVKDGLWFTYDSSGTKISGSYFRIGYLYLYEEYFYNEKGVLYKTVKNTFHGTFLINHFFDITPIYIVNTGLTGTNHLDILTVKSHLFDNSEVQIIKNSEYIHLLSTSYTIERTSTLYIPLFSEFGLGSAIDTLTFLFLPDSLGIDIIVDNYGYSLSSENLQFQGAELNTYLIKGDALFYLRQYEECEMRFYRISATGKVPEDKSKPVLTVPLSIEKNEIDISMLPKGNYLIRVIDYKNKLDLFTKIRRE